MNNPLDVKENDDHALNFDLCLSRLFSVLVNLDFSIGRIVALSQNQKCKSSYHYQ
jgi:hypothetical protein